MKGSGIVRLWKSECDGRTRSWRDDVMNERENCLYDIAQELYLDPDFVDNDDREDWRPIPFYPDYDVSNRGRVWSWLTERYLKPCCTPAGYLYVNLRNGARYREYIHYLVALAFVPNDDPFHKTVVRHLDDNKLHNYDTNLAWGTYKDNSEDAIRNGHITKDMLRSAARHAGLVNRKRVSLTNIDTQERLEFESCASASGFLGVHPSHLCVVLKGKYPSIHGYYAEYLDER